MRVAMVGLSERGDFIPHGAGSAVHLPTDRCRTNASPPIRGYVNNFHIAQLQPSKHRCLLTRLHTDDRRNTYQSRPRCAQYLLSVIMTNPLLTARPHKRPGLPATAPFRDRERLRLYSIQSTY